MSKDPAFLFYSSDFLTGTMFMDNEQVGKFIRLICAQHQKGRLTEKDMLKICGTHDEDIFEKFALDGAGLYYNERLEQEVEKRKAYSESRRNNRKKKEDMIDTSLSYVQHMENENENENIIDNVVIDKPIEEKPKRFVKPTIEQLEAYMEERGMNNVANRFYDHYESNGWKVGKNSMKDWKASVRTWEPNHKKENIAQPTKPIKYFNIEDYDK
jgi:hypothetical protein